jgi:phosphoserine phosphatase RsbU/P
LQTSSTDTQASLGVHTPGIQCLLECISQGIIVADREERILLFSDVARRILGAAASDVPLETWTETYGLFLPDGVTPYPYDQLPLVRAIRGDTVIDEEIFVRSPAVPQGAWLVMNGTPWKDDAGVRHGGIAMLRDVTVDRQSRDALERLSNAVERTADHILITDTHGTILYANPAFERLTGYVRRETYGLTPRLLKSGKEDPSSYSAMWSTLLAGNVFRGTVVNRKKSGQLYSSAQTITPMRDGSGNITHFVSVGRDLTEREAIADQDSEMRLAGLVQTRLYPRLPRREGIDIAGAAYPASATGGDYYDYLNMCGGRLGIAVADVSGHGLGAALIMVATRAALRSCADMPISLDEILDHVNATLLSDLESGRFVTMCLASLDTKALTLTYSSAGHPSGYVLSRAGEIKHVMESTRIPLGVTSDWRTEPTPIIALERGDILVFLTDGILESTGADGRPFGVQNALRLVREHRLEPAQRILEHLLRGVHTARGDVPQEDDMTAVICKVDR